MGGKRGRVWCWMIGERKEGGGRGKRDPVCVCRNQDQINANEEQSRGDEHRLSVVAPSRFPLLFYLPFESSIGYSSCLLID